MQCEKCKIEMKVKELKDDKLVFVCPKCGEIVTIPVNDIKPSK